MCTHTHTQRCTLSHLHMWRELCDTALQKGSKSMKRTDSSKLIKCVECAASELLLLTFSKESSESSLKKLDQSQSSIPSEPSKILPLIGYLVTYCTMLSNQPVWAEKGMSWVKRFFRRAHLEEQLFLDRCDAGLFTLQQVDLILVRLVWKPGSLMQFDDVWRRSALQSNLSTCRWAWPFQVNMGNRQATEEPLGQ